MFFDLDGPILDVRERYFAVYSQCLNELGGLPLSKKDYWDLKIKKVPEAEIIAKSVRKTEINNYLSLREKKIEDLTFLALDNVWTELSTCCDSHFRNSPIILVTLRNQPWHLKFQIEQLNIDRWFSDILLHPNNEKLGNRWHIKAKLIQDSGLLINQKADECIFIGDTENDIRAGQALNMRTVAVSFGIRTRDILLKYKPDEIFDTPMELSDYIQENLS